MSVLITRNKIVFILLMLTFMFFYAIGPNHQEAIDNLQHQHQTLKEQAKTLEEQLQDAKDKTNNLSRKVAVMERTAQEKSTTPLASNVRKGGVTGVRSGDDPCSGIDSYLPTAKFAAHEYDSSVMTKAEKVAMAKATFYLSSPFADLPKPVASCADSLLQSTHGTPPYDDIVLKQIFLADVLPLEKPEVVMPLLLGSNDTASIIDIGANVGQTCIPLAKQGHKVFSFEPVKETCDILKSNIAKEGVGNNIKVNCVALGAVEETIHFGYIGTGGASANDSAAYSVIDPKQPKARVMNTVDRAPIGKLLSEAELNHIHIFKTDTQGYEVDVITGAHDVLHSRTPPRFLFIEYSCGLLNRVDKTHRRKLLELVYAAGYVCSHMVFHHVIEKTAKHQKFANVDTTLHMSSTTKVTGTFSELMDDVCQKGGWSLGKTPLPDELQSKAGWTDLLCFH